MKLIYPLTKPNQPHIMPGMEKSPYQKCLQKFGLWE